jgi:NADH:ubiquinone oxidoreductase subunit E
MINNNHFRIAAFAFIIITLITLVFHVGCQKKVDGVMVPCQLFQEDKKINKMISLVQSKIKTSYRWVKQYFSFLSQLFYEDEEQHDCLVCFAFACY